MGLDKHSERVMTSLLRKQTCRILTNFRTPARLTLGVIFERGKFLREEKFFFQIRYQFDKKKTLNHALVRELIIHIPFMRIILDLDRVHVS